MMQDLRMIVHIIEIVKKSQQAGAELGQAQLQLELGFTLTKVC